MNWRYCIVPETNVVGEMAELGNYTSVEYMRKSKNGDILVKWQGKKPHILYGYTEIEDIGGELQKDEWQGDIDGE